MRLENPPQNPSLVGWVGLQHIPGGASGKEPPPANAKTQEMRVRSLGWEEPLEEEMATQSSILAWRIPWTEEWGRLRSIGLQKIGHD